MLAPNHARPGDPIVMGVVAKAARTHVYAMASWHLFKQDWFSAFAIRRMGGCGMSIATWWCLNQPCCSLIMRRFAPFWRSGVKTKRMN